MAHDCPACGMACYCDGDDTWMESAWTLAHCMHDCDPEDDDLDYGAEDDEPAADAVTAPAPTPSKEDPHHG